VKDDMYIKETKRFFQGKWFDFVIAISPIIVNVLLGLGILWYMHRNESKMEKFETKTMDAIQSRAINKIAP
jgi:hypothetical protein